jgi:arylesterase/paraoxonase
MRRGGIFLSLCIVGLVVLGWRLYGTLVMGGSFLEIQSDVSASCTTVRGVWGAEDIAIDRETGWVFVSSHERRAEMSLGNETGYTRGNIYAYAPDRPAFGYIDLTPPGDDASAPADFRPHGLSLHVGTEGTRTLMVVNHLESGENTIEIFSISGLAGGRESLPALTHDKSVGGGALISPNDVVALDAERFYATNDHGSRIGLLATAEDYLRLNIANVVYFDGAAFSTALEGLTYANGINVNAAGDEIYVSETTDHRVAAYSIEGPGGALLLKKQWVLDFGVDNIDVADDGALWIGGHPKMLDFVAHARNGRVLSPGQVSWIDPQNDKVTNYLKTDGNEISGLSVAATSGGKVIMGQVFDDGLLICE